jgi:hypothetical protein
MVNAGHCRRPRSTLPREVADVKMPSMAAARIQRAKLGV